MRRTTEGLPPRLVRAVVLPLVVLGAVVVYLVGVNTLAANTASDRADRTLRVESPWKDGYSRKFPGCVASVLWPRPETPVAVVVKWRSGKLERIAVKDASRGAVTTSRASRGEIIGACYPR